MDRTIKEGKIKKSKLDLSLTQAKEFLDRTLNPTIVSTHIQGKPTQSNLMWAHFLEACTFINNKDDRIASKIFHCANGALSIDENKHPSTMCTALCGIIALHNDNVQLAKLFLQSIKNTYLLNNIYEFIPEIYIQVNQTDPPLATPSTCGRVIVFLCELFKSINDPELLELAKQIAKYMTSDDLKTFDQWVIQAIFCLSEHYQDNAYLQMIEKHLDKYRKIQIIALPSYVAGNFAQTCLLYRKTLISYKVKIPDWLDDYIEKTINHMMNMQILPSSRTKIWSDAYNGSFIKSIGKTDEIHTISSIMAIGALKAYDEYKI